jgi:hypothetical protein
MESTDPNGRAVFDVGLWRLIAATAGSNPAEGMDVRLFVCCVSMGSGLCDKLIIRSEESCRLCVRACVRVCF